MRARNTSLISRRSAIVLSVWSVTFLFALVTHAVSFDTREGLLALWMAFAVPATIGSAAFGQGFPNLAVAVVVTSNWFALAYCGDMGGPYDHFLLGGFVGGVGLICLFLLSAISAVRSFLRPKRTHTRQGPPYNDPAPVFPERLQNFETPTSDDSLSKWFR